jgi:hypothetical protein
MQPALVAVIALVLLAGAPAAAQHTRTATPGTTPPAASLADLAWLEGEWTGEGFDSVLHENYSRAVGGQMPGHFYAAKDGRPTFYEFVMLAQVGNSIEYRVRHFNPDMTAWEDKDRFIRFPLVAVEKDVWYFDGLTIRRTGPDSSDHIVRVKRKDGSEEDAVLHYRRAK